jgi:hypothetical protein
MPGVRFTVVGVRAEGWASDLPKWEGTLSLTASGVWLWSAEEEPLASGWARVELVDRKGREGGRCSPRGWQVVFERRAACLWSGMQTEAQGSTMVLSQTFHPNSPSRRYHYVCRVTNIFMSCPSLPLN